MNPRGLDLELPSLTGEINRWKCRSGPPLSFPSKRFKNYGREREKSSSSQDATMGREKSSKTCGVTTQGGRRGVFYTPHEI
jgi:hypothetical protein